MGQIFDKSRTTDETPTSRRGGTTNTRWQDYSCFRGNNTDDIEMGRPNNFQMNTLIKIWKSRWDLGPSPPPRCYATAGKDSQADSNQEASFQHRPDANIPTAGMFLMSSLAGPGESFLLPTRNIDSFDDNLKWRVAGVEIVPVDCSSANGFRLRAALEDAYNRVAETNKSVKGVLLITNPMGKDPGAPTPDELVSLLVFLSDHPELRLISDEIYSSGTDSGLVEFLKHHHDKYDSSSFSSRIHVAFTLSPDDIQPEVGAISPTDPALIITATELSSFGLISSQIQRLVAIVRSACKRDGSDTGEAEKTLLGYALPMGFGLLAVPISLFFSFQPEAATVHGGVLTGQSFWMLAIDSTSIGANFLAMASGCILISLVLRNTQPTPEAMTPIKKFMKVGLVSLVMGVASRVFLVLPQPYRLPVGIAVVMGAIASAAYVWCWGMKPDQDQGSSEGGYARRPLV